MRFETTMTSSASRQTTRLIIGSKRPTSASLPCNVTTKGVRAVQPVTGETDVISRYPGARSEMYQVAITGSGGFSELEIGPLFQNELRTATAKVSDNLYPVLEDAGCRGCHVADGVASATRLQFPENPASAFRLEAFAPFEVLQVECQKALHVARVERAVAFARAWA